MHNINNAPCPVLHAADKNGKGNSRRGGNGHRQQPDSAFRLLNTIYFPEDLSKKQYNRYVLLMMQAKDKSYRDVTADTAIFAVKEYYEKKNDALNAAMAAYYCGRVYHEQKEAEKATDAYHQALQWAERTNDYNLKGLIHSNSAILYRSHHSYPDAIEEAKSAVEMYKLAGNLKNEITSWKIIGDCFLLEKKIDSAFRYYDESLKLADSCQINDLQSSIRQSMGVAYREKRNYQQAKKLFDEALALAMDTVEQARILLNIAQLYEVKNNNDSVRFYFDRAMSLSVHDMALLRISAKLRSSLEEKAGNDSEALKYYKEYYDYTLKVFDSEKNNKIREMQEKYNFDAEKNKNVQLSRDKWKLSLIAFAGFIFSVLVILIIYARYRREKEALAETEEKINALQRMQSEENNEFRKLLFDQFNIIIKTATLVKYMPSKDRMQDNFIKRFNTIVYGQDTMDWDKVYRLGNQLFNGLFERIRKQYPNMSEVDFRICCLTCGDLDNIQIGILLQISPQNVMKRKSGIRKQTGMQPREDFHTFFMEKLPAEP
ncbi:MAG: tetratricopeptide repeat protein [Tannerella sp.]|nr:tetratricopeptide repeat protein [Tannerella sp.]